MQDVCPGYGIEEGEVIPVNWMLKLRLQYKIAILSITMMVFALVTVGVLVFQNASERIQANVSNRAVTIGRIIAQVPQVQQAIVSEHPSEVLQPFAEGWRQATGAAFIIIANMEQVRLSYPIPSMVGTHMAPLPRDPVLKGEEYVYIGQGNLAPSLRANVPIFEAGTGTQLGFVSVGFYLDDIYTLMWDTVGQIAVALMVALSFCIVGAVLLAKHVKQATFGLEPEEIATILKERVATLEAIREGVVAVDRGRMIRLINGEAAKMLGIEPDAGNGLPIDKVLPENRVDEVMQTGVTIKDEEQCVRDIVIISNSIPIIVDDRVVGAVVTFRERTEVTQMAEELTGVHQLVDALRAQAHEFKNKLHTIAGLIQLGQYEDATSYAIESQVSQDELFALLGGKIKDSVIFGLLVGKASQMKEEDIEFSIDPDTELQELPVNLTSGDIVLILGNLLQNAIEAVEEDSAKQVWASLKQEAEYLRIRVSNSGPWIPDRIAEKIYERGVTTKGTGNGLGLAMISEKLRLVNGTITHRNLPDGGVEFEVLIPYGRG